LTTWRGANACTTYEALTRSASVTPASSTVLVTAAAVVDLEEPETVTLGVDSRARFGCATTSSLSGCGRGAAALVEEEAAAAAALVALRMDD